MSRKFIIRKTLDGFKSAGLFHFLPNAPLIAETRLEKSHLHYSSLDGTTLRELATRKAHHGQDGHFINPLGHTRHRRKFSDVLYWKLFSENEFKQYLGEQPVTPVRVDWERVKRTEGLSVTFIKHASVMIKDLDQYFYVDPIFNDIFWFIKDFSPLAFNVNEMPEAHHILITHGHYDHLDKSSLATFDRRTHLITPVGYDQVFNDLDMRNRSQLDWYDVYQEGKREITLLPCNHWTMRNPIVGPNRSLWGSYVIKTAFGKTIYVSGDTAFFDGFGEIGRQFDIDLAIMNLGAYEPRWFMAPSHMNVRETVEAFKQLRAKKLIIVHWGTFRLGDEPVHFPPIELRKILEAEGLVDRWIQLGHGETYFWQ